MLQDLNGSVFRTIRKNFLYPAVLGIAFLSGCFSVDLNPGGRISFSEISHYLGSINSKEFAPDHIDVQYGDAPRNYLDFCRAKTKNQPAPLLFYFHCGGFVQGDKNAS